MCLAHFQVRDAVITMLDDWVGERGRVPLERLAPAVHDVTVAPKMSPEGRTAAIAWLGGALAAEQVRLCCTVCHNLRVLIAFASQASRSSRHMRNRHARRDQPSTPLVRCRVPRAWMSGCASPCLQQRIRAPLCARAATPWSSRWWRCAHQCVSC